MEKKNLTIKGTNVSIYIHQNRKNYNYYALYTEGHRLSVDENGKFLNSTIDERKELSEIFESKSIKLVIFMHFSMLFWIK